MSGILIGLPPESYRVILNLVYLVCAEALRPHNADAFTPMDAEAANKEIKTLGGIKATFSLEDTVHLDYLKDRASTEGQVFQFSRRQLCSPGAGRIADKLLANPDLAREVLGILKDELTPFGKE